MKKKERSASRSEAQALPATVAIVEASAAHRDRAIEATESLGYGVHPARGADEALAALMSSSPPDLIIVAIPERLPVVREALVLEDRPVLIAALPGPAETAYSRCDEHGADLLCLRPHSRDGLAAVLRAGVQLQLCRQQVRALRGTESRLRERLQVYGATDQASGFQHIDFFKGVLSMEVKRAKRYGYSLAACLIAMDPFEDEEPPDRVSLQLRSQVASAVAAAMRDIDLPVDLADDRFLAFLPYTDIDGAERVGRRIAAAVRSLPAVEDAGRGHRSSVSVGIAALKPGGPVSFARIMREASMAVRAAQLKGGGRVVVKR